MPATFTHPLAVLPFRRFCPSPLNFAALVIGSMSPDFGYYVHQFRIARFAHTALGTVVICLPTGLFVLALFFLLRRPLCFALPQPHRAALMPLASARPSLRPGLLFGIAASVLLGAWTHAIWDSFTHETAWPVQQIPLLRVSLVRIAGTVFPTFYLLQQLSTFAGGAALAVFYFNWLRTHRGAEPPSGNAFADRYRYTLLFGLAAVALTVAVPAGMRMAEGAHGYFAFRLAVFFTAIYFAAIFVPLFVVSALALYCWLGRGAGSGPR